MKVDIVMKFASGHSIRIKISDEAFFIQLREVPVLTACNVLPGVLWKGHTRKPDDFRRMSKITRQKFKMGQLRG